MRPKPLALDGNGSFVQESTLSHAGFENQKKRSPLPRRISSGIDITSPHRGRIRVPPQRFLHWYDTDYIAPRQAGTPRQMRRGHAIHRLPKRWAVGIPEDLPIYEGWVHAIRRIAGNGDVHFFHEAFRIGQR